LPAAVICGCVAELCVVDASLLSDAVPLKVPAEFWASVTPPVADVLSTLIAVVSELSCGEAEVDAVAAEEVSVELCCVPSAGPVQPKRNITAINNPAIFIFNLYHPSLSTAGFGAIGNI